MTYTVSSGTLNPTIPYHTCAPGKGVCVGAKIFGSVASLWAHFSFSMWRQSAILNLLISEFLSRFRRLGKVCVCILNFVKFGRFAAEIWRYNDFQNAGRPPYWIFEIGHFHNLINRRMRAIMPPNSKFRLNRTTWSRVIQKWFSIWRPSVIVNLAISEFL